MKKHEMDRLGAYVQAIAGLMRLADWKFRIDPIPCDEDSCAQIGCAENRKIASIAFAADFAERQPQDQRHTVCHELLHAHFQPVMAAMTDLRDYLSRDAYAMFRDRFMSLMEYCVDGIADAVAPMLPTMEEAEAGTRKASTPSDDQKESQTQRDCR